MCWRHGASSCLRQNLYASSDRISRWMSWEVAASHILQTGSAQPMLRGGRDVFSSSLSLRFQERTTSSSGGQLRGEGFSPEPPPMLTVCSGEDCGEEEAQETSRSSTAQTQLFLRLGEITYKPSTLPPPPIKRESVCETACLPNPFHAGRPALFPGIVNGKRLFIAWVWVEMKPVEPILQRCELCAPQSFPIFNKRHLGTRNINQA